MHRMLPDGRRLGAHLPLGTGMAKAVERAHAIGASAIQIFADNPTAWRRRAAPPVEQPAFRHRLESLGIEPVAIHAAYLVNLAGPDPEFFERSVAVLVNDLSTAPGYRARYVNVHIGSHRGSGVEVGTERVGEGVARVMAGVPETEDGAMLVLENSAGGGFGLGATVDELVAIAAAIEARGVPARRVGFCLDTAHAWGAGHELSDPAATDRLLDEFATRIGIDRLVMVHLNDSKSELGSHTDRHEHVGAGGIGEVGMAHILRHPLLRDVTYYLETPGMDEGYDAINITRAYDLAAGRPLAPLPPEAMNLRGSRARTAPAEEAQTSPDGPGPKRRRPAAKRRDGG
jgi:deoxyribonuclease-4